MCIKFFEMGTDLFVFGLGPYSLVENWCEIPQPITKRSNRNRVVTLTVIRKTAQFQFWLKYYCSWPITNAEVSPPEA